MPVLRSTRFTAAVTDALAEIRENDLNFSRYVQTEAPPDTIDVKPELAKLTELIGQRNEAEANMVGFLKELGYAR
jgi:type I restriction enzyme M protein